MTGSTTELEGRIRAVLEAQTGALVEPYLDAATIRDAATTPSGVGRRRTAIGLAAAAVVAVVLTGAAVAIALRDDGQSVVTDQAPTTTPITTTTAPGRELGPAPSETLVESPTESEPFELGAGARLLPDPAEWVMVSYTEHPGSDARAEPETTERQAYAFERDGALFVLLVLPIGNDEPPFDPEAAEALYNRHSLYGVTDGVRLGFTALDIDRATFVAAAESLTVDATGGWSLPGAEVRFAERDVDPPSGGAQVQIGYAPIGPDGVPDLSTIVQQIVRRDGLAGLYAELGEASSLGVTRPFELTEAGTGIGTGFVMTGSTPEYALYHRDGFVSSWQTSDARVDADLAAFVDGLREVAGPEWEAAIDGTVDARRRGSNIDPDDLVDVPVRSTPRLLLPEPWRPDLVWDESLWTAEERSLAWAQAELRTGGQPGDDRIWLQTLRRVGSDGPLPDALVEVRRSAIPLDPFTTLGPGEERIEIGSFTGALVTREDVSYVEAVDGELSISIVTATLTADELRSLASAFRLRSADGASGVDVVGGAFEIEVDEAGPFDAGTGAVTSWVVTWSRGSGSSADYAVVQVGLTNAASFEAGLVNAAAAGAEIAAVDDPAPPGTRLVRPDQGLPDLTWFDAESGASITISGDADTIVDLAAGIRTVDEATWIATMGPHVRPPSAGGN